MIYAESVADHSRRKVRRQQNYTLTTTLNLEKVKENASRLSVKRYHTVALWDNREDDVKPLLTISLSIRVLDVRGYRTSRVSRTTTITQTHRYLHKCTHLTTFSSY